MFNRSAFVPGVLVGASLCASLGAFAALGGSDGVRIPYQGRLELNGVGLNGSHTFRFGLYDVASGGTACAGVADQSAEVAAGAFGLVIGPVPESCVVGKPVWLEVSVRGPGGSFVALAGRQRVYPTLGALTSGRGDFSVGGVLDVRGTNPGVSLVNASGVEQGNLGLAGGAGAYSASAVTGDVVLRANTGKVHLQAGAGGSAISIRADNSAVDVSVPLVVGNSLTVTGAVNVPNGSIGGAKLASEPIACQTWSTTVINTGGGVKSATATIPVTSYARTGGGCECGSNNAGRLMVTNAPSGSNAWFCSCKDHVSGDGNGATVAYVIGCRLR